MPKNSHLTVFLIGLSLMLPGSAFATRDGEGLGQVISPGTFEYDGNLDVAGQDRDGAVGGSDYNDPFFDDWTEKPQPEEKKPAKKDMEFDYTAGVTYDMNPGGQKIQAPPLTLDDPIDPPVVEPKEKKAPAKKEMDVDYGAGITFDMNPGGKPVKKAPLTLDDPINPPAANDAYDSTEDEAPDGELGDGESVL